MAPSKFSILEVMQQKSQVQRIPKAITSRALSSLLWFNAFAASKGRAEVGNNLCFAIVEELLTAELCGWHCRRENCLWRGLSEQEQQNKPSSASFTQESGQDRVSNHFLNFFFLF